MNAALGARLAASMFLATLGSIACRQESPLAQPSTSDIQTAIPAAEFADYTHGATPISPDAPGPRRILSAAPNVTEICAALGLLPRLVGRTRYCVHPPEVSKITNFGGLTDANIETLIGLKPDLILMSGTSRELTEQFERLDLRYASVPDNRLEDLFTAITEIGSLTSTPARAKQLSANIRHDLSQARTRMQSVNSQRVLLLIGTLSTPPAPPFVAGPGSFYDDLLMLLGQENALSDGQAFTQLSLEAIVEIDPDVIIELDADGSARPHGEADARNAWSKIGSIKAVKHHRVHVLNGGQYYLLGPRIAQTAAALAEAIAPPSKSSEVAP
jgi:iron complex transport system substrate-binding protein